MLLLVYGLKNKLKTVIQHSQQTQHVKSELKPSAGT